MLAYAQTSFYHPFSIGAGYGVTVAYAGEETLTSSNAFNFNINYHITPFTAVSMEGQVGQLSGGDAMNDTFSKQYLNSYNALLLHADVQLGELMDFSNSQFLNGLKNVYFGTGIGILYNKITDINLIGINNSITYSTYYVKSSNLLIPLRMGYEFKIFNRRDEPQVRFDINYSFNTAFGEGLDGYYNPAGASVKFYSYFSLGLKYGFGNPHAYRKAVYYSAF
ncbi:hypothetical protein Mucpa_4111 [Mucilaginibacter paludis DSM 18603]|uniref:Outer membrane protein beta-barrel domain-containing protein n=2 Tax=Mucilaginibacter TaxID=423349 RepID=H1Y2M3_9SPHI|nr:hypothetical protein Mucpa_4111 [Mucilaginibacter paludis DSM 18603]